MSPDFLSALEARRVAIEKQWRTLLMVEPVAGPLASPEALQYLIPEEFDNILKRASHIRKTPSHPRTRVDLPACECGNNPYGAFYVAGEQALAEAAVLVQSEQAPAERRNGDLTELMLAVRSIAHSQINAFCGACVHRGKAKNCRFAAASA